MSIEKNEIIKSNIHNLELTIQQYWTTVNQEGIWLFIACLGAWSVDAGWIRYFAAVIIFLVFSYRFYARFKETGFFSTIIKGLKQNISTLEKDSDQQKARTHEIEKVEKMLSVSRSVPKIFIYLVCSGFYIVSISRWIGWV